MKKSNINQLETAWNEVAAARGHLESARNIVEDVLSEEEDIFNSRSEKWQQSEKGEDAQRLLDMLQSIIDGLGSSDESTG